MSAPGLSVSVPGFNLLSSIPQTTLSRDKGETSFFCLGVLLEFLAVGFFIFGIFRFSKLLSDEEGKYLAAVGNLLDHRPRLYNHH